MPKVHIYPPLPSGPDKGDGGIRQVIRGQYAHLPALGWEITENPAEADVIHCHVDIPPAYLTLYGDKPILVSNHGAYWSPDYTWHQWSYRTNVNVLSALRQADLTTAVSEWTANALRRASSRDIRVVYHGVDLAEWPMQDPSPGVAPYVLWNKTRIDPICDPQPLMDVASLMSSQRFITTHAPEGQTARNVTVVGTLPFEEGKRLVQRAAVYLCTTRETFGIGTLEALASGVPVVGYDWGGQREIVTHGQDGWLVPPGDIEGLREGILWALSTPEARQAARRKAERFPVETSARRYVELYEELVQLDGERAASPEVSVVIPAYNLERYLPDTIESVLAQTGVEFECIVVDDASPDRCGQIADEYAARDSRVRVIHNEANRYLAGARNVGIAAARGRFILPLDADDMIEPGTLAVLAGELRRRRDLDIAYGGVLFVDEDGVTPTRYSEQLAPGHSGWPVDFRLDWMLLRPGQPLPYCSMFKRDVWELTGGYRERARSSEDCDFWIRTTSYGFVAEMVTRADTLRYRNRPGSMSRTEGFQDAIHRAWYPWIADPALLPAAAYRGNVTGDQIPFPALDPVISVVIPVGPGHERIVVDAIDSVDAQTFRLWECIVVNDTGAALPPLPQWVRVVEPPCCAHSSDVHVRDGGCADCEPDRYDHDYGLGVFGGVAAARNAGITRARGALFLPLDADDILQPSALDVMLQAHMTSPGRPIIYSDFWDEHAPGDVQLYECADYEPRTLITHGLGRAVTALTPVRYWRAVGGYDEELPAWEDWAFAIACAAQGFCERRVMAPLFTYRKWSGRRREANMADFERSKTSMMTKDFGTQGGELMACSTCPGGRGTSIGYGLGSPGGGAAARSYTPDAEGAVMVEYLGAKQGDFQIKSSVSGWSPYVFSANRRRGLVRVEDAAFFDAHVEFRVIDAADVASDPVVRAVTPTPQIGGAVTRASTGEMAQQPPGLPWYIPVVEPTPSPVSIPFSQVEPVVAPSSATWVGGAGGQTAAAATLERPEVVTQPVTVPPGTTGFAAERAALDAELAAAAAPPVNPEVERLMRHTLAELVEMATEAGVANASALGNKRMLATAILAIRGSE